jgi:hypothetical protein
MIYELVSEEEYESLPEEKEQYFVAFESICRRNMMSLISRDNTRF